MTDKVDAKIEKLHKLFSENHALFNRINKNQKIICEMFCVLATDYGKDVGLSDPVIALVTAPKEPG